MEEELQVEANNKTNAGDTKLNSEDENLIYNLNSLKSHKLNSMFMIFTLVMIYNLLKNIIGYKRQCISEENHNY
jgi:hypothetical protein